MRSSTHEPAMNYKGWSDMNLLKTTKTTVVLSSLSLLLILERILLDFRYVAVEMEASLDYMPFTLPYMVFAFVIIGGWIWALLAVVKGSRGSLIGLVAFNALNLFFSVSTMTTLCPLPCGTAWPVTDILVILQLVISIAAILSAGGLLWDGRSRSAARSS